MQPGYISLSEAMSANAPPSEDEQMAGEIRHQNLLDAYQEMLGKRQQKAQNIGQGLPAEGGPTFEDQLVQGTASTPYQPYGAGKTFGTEGKLIDSYGIGVKK